MRIIRINQPQISIVWLIVCLLVAYISYEFFPFSTVDWGYLLLLLLTMCSILLMPIRVNDVYISLERWIVIAVFLKYGLFVEFVFMQVGVIFLLLTAKIRQSIWHKFFINSMIFSATSLLSALVFHFVGGEINAISYPHIVGFGLIYAVTHSLVNMLLLKIYFKAMGQSMSLRSKEALWEYMITIVMVPVSISLLLLYEYLEYKAVFLIAIPLFTLLIAVRHYNYSDQRQEQLEHAVKIGHDLAAPLVVDETLSVFLKRLPKMLSFDCAYIVDLRNGTTFIPLKSLEYGQMIDHVNSITFTQQKSHDDGIVLTETMIFSNRKELSSLHTIEFDQNIQSVMSIPIIRHDKTEALLFLTARQRGAFLQEDIQIVEIVTNYFGVSIEKARHYESTLNKSESCRLTSLPNYRYLTRKLEEAMLAFENKEIQSIAAIMIDIDHFKKVNDTYGHECGNHILIEFAKVLKTFQSEECILARYGGEEFTFVYFNREINEVEQIAEKIRRKVEQKPFKIIPALGEISEEISIHITISAGIAVLPYDAATIGDLLRNADRALYIEGKKAGRNRVGVYHEKSYNQCSCP
ncbi:MAG TPA: diguanylate cyclase [Sporosarcina sp.]|nr:diguanylate cyclase [Sporosarcina sp.]